MFLPLILFLIGLFSASLGLLDVYLWIAWQLIRLAKMSLSKSSKAII